MAKGAKTADQINANWVQGMSGATQKYTQGVQSVTESPMAKAATDQAMARYLSGVQNSVTSGRRAAALNAVTLQYWQQQCVSKGSARLADGAQKGKQKQLAAAQKWAPIYQQAHQAAMAVDKGDPLGRVRAAMNTLRAAAGKPLL